MYDVRQMSPKSLEIVAQLKCSCEPEVLSYKKHFNWTLISIQYHSLRFYVG